MKFVVNYKLTKMRNKKLIFILMASIRNPSSWSKMTKFTGFTVGHDFPVIPLLWHSYNNKIILS